MTRMDAVHAHLEAQTVIHKAMQEAEQRRPKTFKELAAEQMRAGHMVDRLQSDPRNTSKGIDWFLKAGEDDVSKTG